MKDKNNPTDNFDWKAFEAEALKRLANGEELGGADGILTPLIKRLLEASLDGEMQAHVNSRRPNRRNGKGGKQVKTSHGPLDVEVPRDREGTFNSELLPKRRTTLGDGLDNKILALYELGMSHSDIRAHLAEMYGLNVSEATLSAITDKVMDELGQWQNRQLDPVYPFVWLDALHYKVRHEGRVVSRALYTVHRQLRKVTKTKGAFVTDQALVKLLYLAYKRISLKWTAPPQHWGLTLQQLYLLFPDRLGEPNS